ncbi:MAG: DUF1328 domain-containing protein [Pseudomonadota bacterium]
MLNWTITFLTIAIIAGLVGFTTIAGAAMGVAKIAFGIILLMWALAFLAIMVMRAKQKRGKAAEKEE